MASERHRLLPSLACFVCLLGGCSGVPHAPSSTGDPARSGADQYDGWLFNSLTGRHKDATAAAQPASRSAAPSQNEAVGPLVPIPTSPSASRIAASAPAGSAVIPASAETIAGPPPSIPAELPAPTNSVSISNLDAKEEEKKGFEWSDLDPSNIYKKLKAAAGYGPDEKIARAAMQEGRALFSEKKYSEAAGKFATAAERAPDTPLEEDALFLQGESEFFCDQYSKAHDTYGGLLKKYPNSRHLDTVAAREFAIGRYWEQKYDANPTWPITPNLTDKSKPMFDTFGYSIQAYERVRQFDPTGPLADASLMAQGSAYFRQGRYEDAAYNYDILCKEYSNSKYQMSAHLLDLQAKMRVYQGTAYDETPLKQAGKLADQTIKQFGNKLGDERDHVVQARVNIREEMANRDFVIAEYYEQHKYYGAARMYYKSVIDRFPDTEMAAKARDRTEKIRDKPDEPPARFTWLTKMFGSKK